MSTNFANRYRNFWTVTRLLVVDVSKGHFIDSRAIHALLQANADRREARNRVPPPVEHGDGSFGGRFEITGVFDLVEVVSTREDALKVG